MRKGLTFAVTAGLLFAVCEIANAQGEPVRFQDQIWNEDLMWFVPFCGVVSILVKFVNYVIASQAEARRLDTFIKTVQTWIVPLLGWFLSASIVGYLAVVAGFFKDSVQTAIMVGLAWPSVYDRLRAYVENQLGAGGEGN